MNRFAGYCLIAVVSCLATTVSHADSLRLVKDINTEPRDSYPELHYEHNGKCYLTASIGSSGYSRRLWVTDGTEGGTVMVPQITRSVYYFTEMGGAVYFVSSHSGQSRRLWRSDGTEAGTVQIKYLQSVSELTSAAGKLFFSAKDSNLGFEVWVSDGTEEGTSSLKDIGVDGDSRPSEFTAWGDSCYFVADAGVDGPGIWKSDGTEEGTVQVFDANDFDYEYLFHIAASGDLLYFFSTDGESHISLWASDGTEDGTERLKVMEGLSVSFSSSVGETAFFLLGDGSEEYFELWKSDGTEAGTVLIRSFVYEHSFPRWPYPCVVMGDSIYFPAEDELYGEEIWKSDGTVEGTVPVKDLNPEGGSYPEYLLTDGTSIYFLGYIEGTGRCLIESDGSEEGTRILESEIYEVRPFRVLGEDVLFAGEDAVDGVELFEWDRRTGECRLVKDMYPGTKA